MIDLITLHRLNLSDDEIDRIVNRNHLQVNSKDGEVCYDNVKTKNLDQGHGMLILIETSRKLKVEGSLHKLFNKLQYGYYDNYDFFDMNKAKESIAMLVDRKGLPADMKVYNFEIGLNLNVSKDCRAYIDKMLSVGVVGEERQLYVNAKYKDEREKTTIFHRHARKYFKVYDKVFEMRDRKRQKIPDGNILRIETCFRRVENKKIEDFFCESYLSRLIEQFFRDWRTVCFERDISTPKGTGRVRHDLCLQIMRDGREAVLATAKERHESGALKKKEYRNIKEFVRYGFDELKDDIQVIKSPEEIEYRKLLNMFYDLIKS